MSNQSLVISVKPKYIEYYIKGKKTIELRKSIPKITKGDMVLIYSTIPVKKLVIISYLESIMKIPKNKFWELHKDKLGVDEDEFYNYYANYEIAVGLKLKNIKVLNTPLDLEEIKSISLNFKPPQTYTYLNKDESEKFKHLIK